MSKQETIKLETETSAFKTIQAYKDAASQIGLVLKPGDNPYNGDYPRHAYIGLRNIRRVDAIGKEHTKVIKSMSRQLVTIKENGKPIKKEYLTYSGDFRAANHKGVEYGAGFEIGKYNKPRIVHNGNVRYGPKTGEPIGNEKILSGQQTIYEIEVPKSKQERRKLIDSILGEDNHPDNVLYYIRHLDANKYEQSIDASFTYEDFVNSSIEELKDLSQKGAGSKASPYYKDSSGQLRFKKTDTLVTSTSNKAVYQ